MIRSMTAFASRSGRRGAQHWALEMRGVNARGLDLRLRLPDGLHGLEQPLRRLLSARLTRGAVTMSLKVSRDPALGGWEIDEAELDRVLSAIGRVTARAQQRGLPLAPSSASDILAARGVMRGAESDTDEAGLTEAMMPEAEALLSDFLSMREAEGAALARILSGHLDEVAALLAEARAAAAERGAGAAERLEAAIARVAGAGARVEPDRLAQELALLATRSDVTEELDRIEAHLDAARALLADDAPSGRRLDFLVQEFQREAGTLCAKSGSERLTRAGLELKAVIERVREQVQNVE
ncbi:YicC/YloC family endoribonuclease [Limimaricola pyoseonensis]|uniref:TIGR00255 family protein n=1 Tax=Limimaricola pyoseonensis TaxID=521013 RepID=A0A1G7ADK1_9RHOB|nr:YicC/YloC family endoribonuclease [Limimaricola pyoseonensis]SDE11946.1 TIGR00255 family protein [Limimaricola pyoseonensis]